MIKLERNPDLEWMTPADRWDYWVPEWLEKGWHGLQYLLGALMFFLVLQVACYLLAIMLELLFR